MKQTLGKIELDNRGLEYVSFDSKHGIRFFLHQPTQISKPVMFIGQDVLEVQSRRDLSLDHELAQGLINHLQAWVDTGSFHIQGGDDGQ